MHFKRPTLSARHTSPREHGRTSRDSKLLDRSEPLSRTSLDVTSLWDSPSVVRLSALTSPTFLSAWKRGGGLEKGLAASSS